MIQGNEGTAEAVHVLVALTYFSEPGGRYGLGFVRPRLLRMIRSGISTTVLDFSARRDYVSGGIPVISMRTFLRSRDHYQVLVMHQPNVRNHLVFLKRHGYLFPRVVLVFHGHEVLEVSKEYPPPYDYVMASSIRVLVRRLLQRPYDVAKLRLWRLFLSRVEGDYTLVFVSEWLKRAFERNVCSLNELSMRSEVVPNPVGEYFQTHSYSPRMSLDFDFITVRGDLNGSKYAIDVVYRLALHNPDLRFLVVGKGEYFQHHPVLSNLVHVERSLPHEELGQLMDRCGFALMPTWSDTHGVMMAEMATYGMPVVTSDLVVCHETFAGFGSVFYFDNEGVESWPLKELVGRHQELVPREKWALLRDENTFCRERRLILGM